MIKWDVFSNTVQAKYVWIALSKTTNCKIIDECVGRQSPIRKVQTLEHLLHGQAASSILSSAACGQLSKEDLLWNAVICFLFCYLYSE